MVYLRCGFGLHAFRGCWLDLDYVHVGCGYSFPDVLAGCTRWLPGYASHIVYPTTRYMDYGLLPACTTPCSLYCRYERNTHICIRLLHWLDLYGFWIPRLFCHCSYTVVGKLQFLLLICLCWMDYVRVGIHCVPHTLDMLDVPRSVIPTFVPSYPVTFAPFDLFVGYPVTVPSPDH